MNIELRNLSYSYGSITALSDISVHIPSGSFLAVTGSSGSGKTTLLKHLNGLLSPSFGEILIDGRPAASRPQKDLCRHVGLVFQYPEHQLFEETVLKDVMFGPRSFALPDPEEAAVSALRSVGLSESKFNRDPLSLSGGEKRLVAIAGILAFNPDVIVLDEPSAGLDCVSHRALFALLRELNRSGKTIIFTTHCMDDAASCADSILHLSAGRLIAYGSPSEVLPLPSVPRCSALHLAESLCGSGFSVPGAPLTLDALEQAILTTLSAR